jgi:hypothetical protein
MLGLPERSALTDCVLHRFDGLHARGKLNLASIASKARCESNERQLICALQDNIEGS